MVNYYRNALWVGKGIKEYSHAGYKWASKRFRLEDLEVNCQSRVYMITGAEGGLGKVVAFELAKRGASLHLVCQDPDRGEETLKTLVEVTKNKNISLHVLDLTEPEQVANFAKQFKLTSTSGGDLPSLHVLVHTAGHVTLTRKVNSKGMETNFARFVLGTHILTTLLVPLLNKSAEPRVIMASSSAMLLQRLDPDDLNLDQLDLQVPPSVIAGITFCQNLRRQAVLAEHYADRYPGIHFSVVNPGWINSQEVIEFLPNFLTNIQVKLRTERQGADTILWLAISRTAIKFSSGQLFLDRKPTSFHLPFSGTRTSTQRENYFLSIVDDLLEGYVPA